MLSTTVITTTAIIIIKYVVVIDVSFIDVTRIIRLFMVVVI